MQTLIPFSFIHPTFTCSITQFNAFRKTSKPTKKNDTQPRIGTRGNATPFPFKTHLEQQEFKNRFMSQLELVVKLPTC